MKKYLAYPVYFFFWLLFFAITRAIFLLYHFQLTEQLDASDIFSTFLYGMRMDASFAGYICIFPFLVLLLKSIFLRFPAQGVIRIYTITLVVILSFISIADLELYHAWGFRMDATPLQYFKNPKEMAATVSSSPVLLLLFIFLLTAGISWWLYIKKINRYIDKPARKIHPADLLFSAFLIAVLFIPIRGGIQKIPMNISDAYFSQKLYANHAAINLPWNIMFSVLNWHDEGNPFDYFPEDKAEQLVHELYNTGADTSASIISGTRPNVIFIILESFTAKWVGHLGGVPGVTPGLDKIASEGLAFTNIYAAGDRSEKGIMAVFSGYPNQAITSIIKTPVKTRNLPSINQVLREKGYATSFTYGGELEFANIKSYLLNTGFQKYTDKYSFPVSQRTTSWGVHDQYVFNRFFDDMAQEKQPFFAGIFSLSSHEPYDVPLKHFPGTDETTLFKNSIYYTDSVLNHFIEKSRKASWWPNTLVVIVADHGHPLPGHDPNDRPGKFHIPLIFTGGALQKKGIVSAIGSQTDIITTVLHQLGISSEAFKWGKNLLNEHATPFAFYSFNNGFGFVTPKGTATVDNVSKKVIYMDAGYDTGNLKYGKAYMEYSYQDFLNR